MKLILIDFAQRRYLAKRIAHCQRPAIVEPGVWRLLQGGELAAVDEMTLATCCDLVGEDLVPGMIRASRDAAHEIFTSDTVGARP